MKDNQITVIFDAWVAKNYERLRQEVFNTTFFDEDAFQQAYINIRCKLASNTKESDFRNLYLSAYRKASKQNVSQGMRYYYPTEFFFSNLRADEAELTESNKATEPKVTAKMIDSYVKNHLPAVTYMIFNLHWNMHLTFEEMREYTGHSFGMLNRHLKIVQTSCRSYFTPPTSCNMLIVK